MEERFDRAYRAHAAAIYAYLVRMTGDRGLAEELAQEAFVRLLENLPRLRADNGAVAPWLYRVATRLVLDDRRRRSPEALVREDAVPAPAGARVEDRELAEIVRAEVRRLPGPLRATFVLRAYQELGFARIADATGVSERAAKDRFRKARDLLFQRLAPLVREIRA
jgi:RNA polymerase sigma-70 factor (ECF subfamily)